MDVISPMNEHEHENEHTPPVLDTLIQNRPIQMLKAIVPYLYEPQQRMVSMMIRMIELRARCVICAAPNAGTGMRFVQRVSHRTYSSDSECPAGILHTTGTGSD